MQENHRHMQDAMRKLDVVKKFFDMRLPKELRIFLDLSTLTLQDKSFVDESLAKDLLDLVYAVDCQGCPAFLYLLIAQASPEDRSLGVHTMRSMMKIVEGHVKETQKVPIIYSMILYCGSEPYAYAAEVDSLFESQNKDCIDPGSYLSYLPPPKIISAVALQ